MNIVAPEVGIDVSKMDLVVSVDKGKPFKKPNSEAGAVELAQMLPPGSTVHLESTGGYERIAVKTLRDFGFEVRVHNPLRARRLAQGLGPKAKTDPIDARMLSATGSLLPTGKAKSEERRNLADFSRSIDAVKKTITSFKNRSNMPGLDPDAKRVYELVITALEKEVKGLESQFARRVKSSSYRLRYDLAKSVPHIGPVAARVCVCELPEDLPERSPARMSSYAGVAPINHSSGTYNPAPKIARGNKRLKKALYMAAISALRQEVWAKTLYHRLIAKGKTHDQAIVPIMRKLLVKVVCVLKRGTPWQAVPLKA